jgi:hypothetical protein
LRHAGQRVELTQDAEHWLAAAEARHERRRHPATPRWSVKPAFSSSLASNAALCSSWYPTSASFHSSCASFACCALDASSASNTACEPSSAAADCPAVGAAEHPSTTSTGTHAGSLIIATC